MTFDEQAFKRAWRALCAERGIDPLEGATRYQAANANAERRKKLHDRYASVMTLLHFARHPERLPVGGVRWRARKDWWTKPEYWHNPPEPRMSHCFIFVPQRVALHSRVMPCEDAAILNVQKQANDARDARFVEKIYNHPPQGRARVTRKFLPTGAMVKTMLVAGVRQIVIEPAREDEKNGCMILTG